MTATISIHVMLDADGNYALAPNAEDLDLAFEEAHGGPPVAPTAVYGLALDVEVPVPRTISAVVEGKPNSPTLRIVR